MLTRPLCRMLAAGVFLSWLPAVLAWAEPRVQLEVVTQPDFPMIRTHEWGAALAKLNLGNIRIRAGQPTDRPQIKQVGTGDSATYHVTGVLMRNNTLRLPEAEFRMTDTAGLKAWLEKLKTRGQAGMNQPPVAFGLTAEELVAVHDALSRVVPQKTRGKKPFDVMKAVAGQLAIAFTSDAAARNAMVKGEAVEDELDGLSAGTVLAAVLRPLGLVMLPQRQGDREIKLAITSVRNVRESWPVGWPPETSPNETLPTLFNFLEVDIQNTPLSEALVAIAARLEAPILLDHNSLARQSVDLSKPVSLPSGRLYFKRILTRLLSQLELTSELRVDEAGNPFLWISTLRQ